MEAGKSDETNMSDAVEGPHRFIVGRTRELDLCRTAFGRMLAGRRQIVLISGEAGIGKTCCAEAVTESAEEQGALVLWGRCHEEAGAPRTGRGYKSFERTSRPRRWTMCASIWARRPALDRQ